MTKQRYKSHQRYRSRRYYKKSHRHKPVISNNLFAAIVVVLLVMFALWQWSGLDKQATLLMFSFFLIIIIISIFAVIVIMSWRDRKKMLALNESQVQVMGGIEFEKYLKELLKSAGYSKVAVTPPQGDYGADLFAEKDGVSYAIQAKRYHEKKLVGVDAVQQISSAREYYDKDRAMVITTSYFSDAAKKMAKKNKVILINKSELSALINKYANP